MAPYTWDHDIDDQFDRNANYVGDAGHPGDGDVFVADGTELGAGLPASNLPTAGTIGLTFASGYEAAVSGLDGGGVSWGAVTVAHASAVIEIDQDPSAIVVTEGEAGLATLAEFAADITLNGADANLGPRSSMLLSGTISDGGAGGYIYAESGLTVTFGPALTTGAIKLYVDGNGAFADANGFTISNGGAIVAYDDDEGPRTITGDVTIASGGTVDWSVDTADLTIDGAFIRQAGGILVGNSGNELIVTGDVDLTGAGGTIANTHIRMKGTGTYTSPHKWIQGLVIDATSTSTAAAGTNYTTALEVESGGTLAGGAGEILCRYPLSNQVDIQGTCSCVVTIRLNASRAMSGKLATTETLNIYTNDNYTLTHSGVTDVANLNIYGGADNMGATLIETGASVDAGDVALGTATGTNRYGVYDVSGVSGAVTIGNLTDAAGGSSALVLGSKDITLAGDWDGTNIAVTGSGTVTGDNTMTIDNMGDPGAVVKVYGGVVDGGSNHANWEFVTGGGGTTTRTGTTT